jgi:Tol biopolymer transport system component
MFKVYTPEGESGPATWIISLQATIVPLASEGEYDPALSHDKRWLAFMRNSHPGWTDSRAQLWIRDRRERTESQVSIPENCLLQSNGVWSPDDARLYFLVECDPDRDLWSLDLRSWQTRNLTGSADRQEGCPFRYPLGCLTFDPYRPEIVLIQSSEIVRPIPTPAPGYIPRWESSQRLTEVNTTTGEYRILDGSHEVFGPPSFSPDGESIAYDGGHIYHRNGEIETLNPPDFGYGALPEYVTLVNPSWSPDGTKIAWLAAHIDGNMLAALVVYDLENGGYETLLTYDPYYSTATIPAWEGWPDDRANWSPDGRYLALNIVEFPTEGSSNNVNMFWETHCSLHVFDRNGKQVFSQRGTDLTNVSIWSPDGKWLAFTTHDRAVGDAMHIFLVILQTESWQPFVVDVPFGWPRLTDWIDLLPGQ